MSWGKYSKIQNFVCSKRQKSNKTDKGVNESVKTISYEIKFIASARLLTSSFSNLVDNLAEELLWRLHFQISLITEQKKFIKLNVKIVIAYLNMKVSRMI